jgi:hypothetical protein
MNISKMQDKIKLECNNLSNSIYYIHQQYKLFKNGGISLYDADSNADKVINETLSLDIKTSPFLYGYQTLNQVKIMTKEFTLNVESPSNPISNFQSNFLNVCEAEWGVYKYRTILNNPKFISNQSKKMPSLIDGKITGSLLGLGLNASKTNNPIKVKKNINKILGLNKLDYLFIEELIKEDVVIALRNTNNDNWYSYDFISQKKINELHSFLQNGSYQDSNVYIVITYYIAMKDYVNKNLNEFSVSNKIRMNEVLSNMNSLDKAILYKKKDTACKIFNSNTDCEKVMRDM